MELVIKKLLFICTANVARSRTAEDLFAESKKYEAKSAGTEYLSDGNADGGQLVSQELINGADALFFMENCHLEHLRKNNFDIRNKEIYVLNIQDVYSRGDEDLVELLKFKLLYLGSHIP